MAWGEAPQTRVRSQRDVDGLVAATRCSYFGSMSFAVAVLASLAVLHGTPQGGGGPGRVLIIGLDGVRSDAMRLATTPNINTL